VGKSKEESESKCTKNPTNGHQEKTTSARKQENKAKSKKKDTSSKEEDQDGWAQLGAAVKK